MKIHDVPIIRKVYDVPLLMGDGIASLSWRNGGIFLVGGMG